MDFSKKVSVKGQCFAGPEGTIVFLEGFHVEFDVLQKSDKCADPFFLRVVTIKSLKDQSFRSCLF